MDAPQSVKDGETPLFDSGGNNENSESSGFKANAQVQGGQVALKAKMPGAPRRKTSRRKLGSPKQQPAPTPPVPSSSSGSYAHIPPASSPAQSQSGSYPFPQRIPPLSDPTSIAPPPVGHTAPPDHSQPNSTNNMADIFKRYCVIHDLPYASSDANSYLWGGQIS
jgi:hypothetical protein